MLTNNSATANITIVTSDLIKLPVYRFFNKTNGAHLYTISETEKGQLIQLTATWSFEGTVFAGYELKSGICVANTTPVYRFFNKNNGAHLYTIDEAEKNTIINTLTNFVFEDSKFCVYSFSQSGTLPVYRFFNTTNGAHLYTISEEEKSTIINTLTNFIFEGIKFYVPSV